MKVLFDWPFAKAEIQSRLNAINGNALVGRECQKACVVLRGAIAQSKHIANIYAEAVFKYPFDASNGG